ncbi:jg10441 [Pararge aegeria aegeria]|uniref:Jg10441 protein n=1 Tax=Pararge aegeria aegeria TaxID=348720 RepID=A0A8S4RG05_9NEOP|nr:jg10441 [Pararge aegeria aegeria]
MPRALAKVRRDVRETPIRIKWSPPLFEQQRALCNQYHLLRLPKRLPSVAGFLPARSERSSSEHSPLDAAELLRDAPLYPPLRDNSRTLDETPETLNEENNDKTSDLSPFSKNFQPFFDTNEFDEDSIDNTDVNELTGVNYDETETSIEDSSILVTPDDNVLQSHNNIFEILNDSKGKVTDFDETVQATSITKDETINVNEENIFETNIISKSNITPEDYNDIQNVPQVLETINQENNGKPLDNIKNTNELLEGEDLNASDSGFIVAPGSNIVELNRILMAEEARVDAENKKLSGDSESTTGNVTKASMAEDDSSEAFVTEENFERKKRSSTDWEKPTKSRRVKTGDTILNIRGAVRDAIGDAGAAPGMRASSRVDAFVIRPAPVMRDEPREQMREARRDRVASPPPQPQKQEKELLVEPHAHARIVCDLVNVTNLRWYKDSEQVNLPSSPGGGESAWRQGDAVEIARASRGHAARWRCSGRDKAGRTVTGEPTRLLIYEPVRSVYLAVDGRRLDAGNTWVPVRDKTVLEVRCVAEGGVPPPELSWRLLALEPALDHRPYLRIHHTNYSVEFDMPKRSFDFDIWYSVRSRHAPPADPPSFVISRWPGFGVSLWAGGAAALRCDVDANPPARAAWMRDTDRVSSSPTPLETGAEDGAALGSATLRWVRLSESHAGWYRCRARWMDIEYSSIGYYLNVLASDENTQSATEPGEKDEEPDHQKVEVPLGGNVQLHCPKGSVGCWWRRVVGNASDAWAPAGSHHAHGVLGMHSETLP